MEDIRIYRSVLFVPGSNVRAIEKVPGLACDAVIFDLEDAVADHDVADARAAIVAALADVGSGAKSLMVRVNAVGTPEFGADAASMCAANADGIVIPKVNSAADLDTAAQVLGDAPLWPMIETPMAVIQAAEIAAHPNVAGLIVGPNDLAKDLHVQNTPERTSLMMSLQTTVLAARASGKVCLDGVYAKFKDAEGFIAECGQGRMLGFDGKTLIHPAQIEAANAAFAPSETEVTRARAHVAAFDAVAAQGGAVAVVDGEMVEELHATQARAVLARFAHISENTKGTPK